MEYRQLGQSGLMVSVLSPGTMTFGGRSFIDVLVEIAGGRKVSPAQIALAYMLGRPGVTSLVVGARTEAQLTDNLAAANAALSPEETSLLDAASLPRLLYPYWHQAKTAKERLSAADLALLRPYLTK